MGEISIKVSIANRIYPLKVRLEEEEGVRKAVRIINEKIKDYEENFSVRDKQDLLAMCAIQLATEMLSSTGKTNVVVTEFDGMLTRLDQMVSSYLQEEKRSLNKQDIPAEF